MQLLLTLKNQIRDIVWDLPASDLLGVGRATEAVLANYGIRTIGALANASEDLIRRKLGKCGVACIRFAQGLDNSRVMEYDYESPVKSVGHGLTTKADLENSAEVWALMLALSQDIGHKLRKYDKRAGGVQIDIRNNRLKTKQWQCKLSPHTNSTANCHVPLNQNLRTVIQFAMCSLDSTSPGAVPEHCSVHATGITA